MIVKKKEVNGPTYEYTLEGLTQEQMEFLYEVMFLDDTIPKTLERMFPQRFPDYDHLVDLMGELRNAILHDFDTD